MAHDVFISHARQDKSIADAVCANLEQAGIRCWIAPRDIEPGADWGASLMDGLKTSKILVLVLSSSANASPHIRREVERAVHQGITVVPLRVEDVLPEGALEYHLGTVHWLDAMTPPLEAHLNRLVDILSAILTRVADRPAPPREEQPPPPPPKREVAPPPVTPAPVFKTPDPPPVMTPPPVQPPVAQTPTPVSPVVSMPSPTRAPEDGPLSEFSRILYVFVAPRKTFADIRRNPRWWPPLVLNFLAHIVWAWQLALSINRGQYHPSLPLLQNIGISGAYLLPFISLIFYFLTAGVWFGIFKKLAGGVDLTFPRTLAVLFYSSLIWILEQVLNFGAYAVGLPRLPLNAAYVLPRLMAEFNWSYHSPLVPLILVIDVFTIWTLLVAGFGMSEVSKVKRVTAIVCIFVVHVVIAYLRFAISL